MQRTAGSIGFITKCKKLKLTPTFAKVEGNFSHHSDRYTAVKLILDSNLREKCIKLRALNISWFQLKNKIIEKHGRGTFKMLYNMCYKAPCPRTLILTIN